MDNLTSPEKIKAPIRQSITPFEHLVIHLPESYVNTVSGGLAGAVSAIVSCPLDVIKTKLQAQGGFHSPARGEGTGRAAYRGIKGTAITVWREDGVRGFYRGLSPLMLGYVPTWAVYLSIYNSTQEYFHARPELGVSNFAVNVYASLVAGACSTTITNPIWVIKTRLMSQSSDHHDHHPQAGGRGTVKNGRTPWHYNGTLDAVRKMYTHEGVRSFYSGLTPALLGLTHVAVQFPLYEIFKARLTGIQEGEKETAEERAKHFWGLASAVFLSKVVASTATYPHEVVRTRLQTQQRGSMGDSIRLGDHGRPPGDGAVRKLMENVKGEVEEVVPRKMRGTIEICQTIYRQEGWRGFYAGLGTNLLRAVPSAMTTLLTFEYVKKAIFTAQEHAREDVA